MVVRAVLGVTVLFGVISCGGSSEPESADLEYENVQEIIDQLHAAGIECSDLEVRDAEDIAREREAAPEPSLPPGAVPLEGPDYRIRESGICEIEGSPRVAGETLGTTITVYEDDEHLQSIPEEGLVGVSLIYGDTWQVSLAHLDLTEKVADALGGRMVPAGEIPEQDVDPKALAGRCFFVAALPPGLEAAAGEFGKAADEPEEYARLFAESAYFLPQEARAQLEEQCLRGFKYEDLVRSDDPALSTQDFEDFWFRACAYAESDFTVQGQLGFAGGFSYVEFGRRLTDELLESKSLSEAELTRLRKVCGRGVKEGAIGGDDA